jgi:glycosyltransferase involved in cell wall biosynthesis
MSQDLDAELEMIVVDNASEDGTEALMEKPVEHASRPLTYVRLPADRGPAGGRNLGLDVAQGEFIAFTDSDCAPDPLWLKSGSTWRCWVS